MILKKKDLPKRTTKLELKKLFKPFRYVKALERSSTSVFVQMLCMHKAKMAVSTIGVKTWKGKLINVMPSKTDSTTSVF